MLNFISARILPPASVSLLVLVAVLTGCSGQDTDDNTFAEFAGFEEIRATQSSKLPNRHEQDLLELHRPRLFIGKGAEGSIDFYADYISAGCLQTSLTDANDCTVTQAELNAAKNNPNAIFTHNSAGRPSNPIGYGAINYGTVKLPGLTPDQRKWIFLRYNFAFRMSGLSAGIENWQKHVLGIIADLDDWHQLDHYTAVIIVLDENEHKVAVMLQQHNYMHTYLIGTDSAFPVDDQIAIDAALRSNELFPHRDNPAQHPAASFLTGAAAGWIAGDSKRPFTGTLDHTSPDREIDYQLKFLPPNDAFYIFRGHLGAKRILPGRDGPPGAIYFSVPQLSKYELALPMFYWVKPDAEFVSMFQDVTFDTILVPLPRQRERFTQALIAQGLVQ